MGGALHVGVNILTYWRVRLPCVLKRVAIATEKAVEVALRLADFVIILLTFSWLIIQLSYLITYYA